MKKNIFWSFALSIFLMLSNSNFVHAQESTNFNVQILSPKEIKEFPGKEFTIKVKIMNKIDKDIHNVFTYITMANLSKKWTVNLEDYSADAGTDIGTIKAHQFKVVELPIMLVYTADYYLYTTVVSKDNPIITSSDAIPVKVLGNTKIVPMQVATVAISIPTILLIALIYSVRRNKKKINDH
jgi:hypothetical protein